MVQGGGFSFPFLSFRILSLNMAYYFVKMSAVSIYSYVPSPMDCETMGRFLGSRMGRVTLDVVRGSVTDFTTVGHIANLGSPLE